MRSRIARSAWIVRIALACLVAVSLPARADEEPTWLGKPASYWVDRLRREDARERAAAASALGKIGPAALPPLLAVLRSGDARLRRAAAQALLEFRHVPSAGRRALIDALRDGDAGVRAAAARALGPAAPNGGAAVSALAAALADPDPQVRCAAALALRDIGPAAATAAPALALAALDTNTHASLAAAAALAAIAAAGAPPAGAAATPPPRAPPAPPATLLVALKDKDAAVRLAAVQALVQSGPAAGPHLLPALGDPNADVRSAAAAALARLAGDSPDLRTALARTVVEDRSLAREVAATVLAQAGPAAAPTLVELLTHGDLDVRQITAMALRAHLLPARDFARCRAAVPNLIRRLEDGDEIVSSAVLEVLGRIPGIGAPGAPAVPRLMKELGGDTRHLARRAAAAALASIGQPAAAPAVPALTRLLADPEVPVRQAAADALWSLCQDTTPRPPALPTPAAAPAGPPTPETFQELVRLGAAALPRVLALIRGPETAHSLAVKVLEALGPTAREAIPSLVDLLRDPDPTVAGAAASALRGLGDLPPESVGTLLTLAHGSDPTLRARGLDLLGTLGPPARPAAHQLVSELDAADPKLRQAALAALTRIGAESDVVVPRLLFALRDPEPGAAQAALAALPASRLPAADLLELGAFALTRPSVATRCGGVNLLARAGPAATPFLLRSLHDPSPDVRLAAANSLLPMAAGSALVATGLIQALHDEDPYVRNVAEMGLAKLRPLPAPALAALLDVCAEPNGPARARALHVALAVHTAPQELLPLVWRSLKDEDPGVREHAVEGLMSCHCPADTAAPALAAALGDRYSSVRFLAAKVVLHLGPVPSENLIDALGRARVDRVSGIRGLAATALARLASEHPEVTRLPAWGRLPCEPLPTTGFSFLRGNLVPDVPADASRVRTLVQDLADVDPIYRRAAAEVCGQMRDGAREAIPALARAMNDDEEIVRGRAVQALGEVGPAAAPALAHALRNRHPDVRRDALGWLRQIDPLPVEAIRGVMDFLQDEEGCRFREATDLLARGGPQAQVVLPIAVAALRSPDAGARLAALRTLARLEGAARGAAADVLAALNDSDPEVRLAAVRSVPALHLTLSAASAALLPLLAHADDPLRAAATDVLAFAQYAAPTAQDSTLPLLVALRLGPPPVRLRLIGEVAHLGAEADGFLPVLLRLLEEKPGDPEVRTAAARSLASLAAGSPEVLAALERGLGEDPRDLRVACATSLVHLGQRPAGVEPVLREAIANGDPGERQAAIAPLAAIQPDPETGARALVPLLGQPEVATRIAVLDALASWASASPTAFVTLVRMLDDPVAEVRHAAERDLVPHGPLPTGIRLARARDRRQPVPVRAAALEALGVPGTDGAGVLPLLASALAEPDEEVRLASVSALTRLGSAAADALPAVVDLVNDKRQSMAVRSHAATAVRALDPAGATSTPVLVALLRERDTTLQATACTILAGSLTRLDPEIRAALRAALAADDPTARIAAAIVLAGTSESGPELLPALLEAVGSADSRFRFGALHALEHVGGGRRETSDALVRFLADGNPAFAACVSQVLLRMGPAAIGALGSALSDPDRKLRLRAIETLRAGGQAATPAVPALTRVLRDAAETSELRLAAAVALGDLGAGGTDVCAAVLAALRDPDATLRSAAAGALARLRPQTPEAAQDLVAVIRDPGLEVEARLAAVKALQDSDRIGAVIPDLLTLVIDTKQPALLRAVLLKPVGKGAGDLPGAAPALVRILSEAGEDREVRCAAALALGDLGAGGADACAGLLAVLRGPDVALRSAAATALARLHPRTSEAARALLEALEEPGLDLAARLAAVAALQGMDLVREHTPRLVALVADTQQPARLRAAVLRWVGARAGDLPELAPALRRLARDDEKDLRALALGFLAQFVDEDKDTAASLLQALHDPAAGIRAQAAQALGSSLARDRAVAAALAGALTDAEPGVRAEVDQALLSFGPAAAVALPAVERILRDESQPGPRRATMARILARIGPAARAALPALLAVARGGDAPIRCEALRALGAVAPGDPATLPALRDAAGDGDPEVREAAVEALRELGTAALPTFVAGLKDPEPGVRQAAGRALLRLGPEAAPAVSAAADLLKCSEESTGLLAASLLERIGPEARPAAPALVAALRHGEPGVRCAAARALGRIAPAARLVFPALLRALKDKEESVRSAAIEAIECIGGQDRAAIPFLLAAVKEADAGARAAAVRALATVGGRDPVVAPALRAVVKDPDAGVRRAAVAALVRVGADDAGTAAVLIDALADADAGVRAQAVEAAEWLAAGRAAAAAVVALGRRLADGDVEVRRAAVAALGRLGTAARGAQADLAAAAAADADRLVRVRAVKTLARLGGEARTVAPVLLGCCRDAEADVRVAAAAGLYAAGAGAAAAVPALVAALTDPDARVRYVAAETLGRYGPEAQEAMRALIFALRDEDADVRRCATEALKKVQAR